MKEMYSIKLLFYQKFCLFAIFFVRDFTSGVRIFETDSSSWRLTSESADRKELYAGGHTFCIRKLFEMQFGNIS